MLAAILAALIAADTPTIKPSLKVETRLELAQAQLAVVSVELDLAVYRAGEEIRNSQLVALERKRLEMVDAYRKLEAKALKDAKAGDGCRVSEKQEIVCPK